MMGRWGGWGWHSGFGFGWVGMLINLLIFAVIAFMFIRFMRNGGLYHYGIHTSKNTAEEILRQRYAKGELTKEQFVEMSKDIKD